MRAGKMHAHARESSSLARARVFRPLTYLQPKLATTGTLVDSHHMDRSTGGALHQNRRGQGSNPVQAFLATTKIAALKTAWIIHIKIRFNSWFKDTDFVY